MMLSSLPPSHMPATEGQQQQSQQQHAFWTGDTKIIEGRSQEELEGEGLRRAGRSITGCIWEDCRLPDPSQLISRPDDSPVLAELNPAMQFINDGLVKLVKLNVIPEMLLSQYTDRSSCFMGLMADIGRAWMTVDERLYLWDYKGGRDVANWNGDAASGPIIDMQLVRPKKGVFVEAIQWLLVVVTPVEIQLLGLELLAGDLVLHETKLVFSSDQVNMLATVGTPNGRIFCAGQDGNIYELEYEAEEGWFTRRCRKTNRTGSVISRLAPTFLRGTGSNSVNPAAILQLKYDASRNAIWSMTEGGQMNLYGLEHGGWSHQASLNFFPAEVQRMHPFLLASSIGEKLVGIHPIGKEESGSLCLMAVTTAGLRLYYSTESPTSNHIRLAGIKVPQPINDLKPSGKAAKFNLAFLAASMANVHASYQRAGIYMASGALSEDEDILAIRSVRANTSGEVSSEWRLEGKVWEIAEAGDAELLSVGESMSNWWLDLVQGHRVLPRQLLCLTNAGLYVFEKERPVDTLARVLAAACGNVEGEAVQAFFQRFLPADQAIAVALVLATRPSGGDVSFWAANAAFKYGGEPSAGPSGEFQPSALNAGLYRFVGRLLASLWKQRIADGTTALLSTGASFETLIGQLKSLSRFFEVNSTFILRRPAPNVTPKTVEAFNCEYESLQNLERLVQRTTELLQFLAVCYDYRLPMPTDPSVDMELLASSPLRGPALVKELGAALVQQQLRLQASVESLCAVLRERSPTFFTPGDVLLYEGTDALERAMKPTSSSRIREQLLSESLGAFLKAPNLSIEKACEILERYKSLRFWPGVLALGQSKSGLFEKTLWCLEDLLVQEKEENEAAAVFSQALSSNNAEFLAAFYDWLFAHSIAGAVLLSDPSFNKDLLNNLQLSAFEELEQQEILLRSKAHADICWKYLAKHGKSVDSGRVLLKLARAITPVDQDPTLSHVILPLEERIQYLSMAVATLNSSSGSSIEAAEAEEILEVALVQLDLLNALKQRQPIPSAQLQLVHSRLYDLTTLFAEFSEPLALPAVSLLILHTAGHADEVLVSRLWQRVLLPEQAMTLASLDAVQRQLSTLAGKLWPSQVAFPLGYLVDMLALIAFKAIREPEDEAGLVAWFRSSWKHTPVSSDQVNGIIESMLKVGGDSFWTSAERKRFLRLLIQ